MDPVAKPLELRILNSGTVEMVAQCSECGSINTHVINHAMKLEKDCRIVRFGSMGFWPCHNTQCFAKYQLFVSNHSNDESLK